MLLILVISFIICWSPAQIFYLMLWVFEDIRQDTETAASQIPQHHSPVTSTMNDPFVTSSSSHYSVTPSPSTPFSTTTSATSAVFGSAAAAAAASGSSSWYSLIYYTLYFSFHWLSCAHTIINPFVYCFFSNNFQVKKQLPPFYYFLLFPRQ